MYRVAEKFKSIQGEGLYAGTPMAFIRFAGCSVGKKVCHHCDTDFDNMMPWRGGGNYTAAQLLAWVGNYDHICLTGGEPLDQDLFPFWEMFNRGNTTQMIHIETSGTVERPSWMFYATSIWLCVSPKPGWREELIAHADEIKVIVPGLGNGERWPTLNHALRWAEGGKIVYLQPRNGRLDVDKENLMYVQDIIREYPTLRLSVQMHKILRVQ